MPMGPTSKYSDQSRLWNLPRPWGDGIVRGPRGCSVGAMYVSGLAARAVRVRRRLGALEHGWEEGFWARKAVVDSGAASLDYEQFEERGLRLVLKGTLNAADAQRFWPQVMQKVAQCDPSAIEVDAGGVESLDTAGMALLLELKAGQEQRQRGFRIQGLRDDLTELMRRFDPGPPAPPKPAPPWLVRAIHRVGEISHGSLVGFHTQVAFLGEIFVRLLSVLVRPRRLRWADTFLIAEKAGANAVGIVALMGFLIGLILAFQSAIGMRKFGAEIYVADLVVLVLFRELGPLITAFILTSRSGSAFAAELGTMKVNEEVDALVTMGVDPVQFLALPRLVAAICVMPLLTLFNELFGLIGCGLVMRSFGFPVAAYIDQIQEAASLGDLFGGLVKTFVFGALIAGIGCLRGLQTGNSPSAVGDSATRAVVSGIVAIVVADGVFAVLYYYLGV